MDWICLHDRQLLKPVKESYVCPGCNSAYEMYHNAVCFTTSEQDKDAVRRSSAKLDKLYQLLDTQSPGDVAHQFCSDHPCSRNLINADWKFFLPVTRHSTVVELGAGFGDDTVELAKACEQVIAFVPGNSNAMLVQKRIELESLGNVNIGIIRQLEKLPVPDRSTDIIALEDAALMSFQVSRKNLGSVAGEWKRIVKQDGYVFIGLKNPRWQYRMMRWLKSRLQSGVAPESMNRYLKQENYTEGYRTPGLRNVCRAMLENGFELSAMYAPFPDENKTKIVAPVNDYHVMHYFLTNMIRKNSPVTRLAIPVADMLARLHLLRYVVPYYFLIYKKS